MAINKLPRLTAIVVLADSNGRGSSSFSRFWDSAMTAIENNEDSLNDTDGQLSAAIDRIDSAETDLNAAVEKINQILSGEVGFDVLNVNGATTDTLGSAVSKDVGTSGNAIPALDTDNEWSGAQVFDLIVNSLVGFAVNGTQVVGAQVTGWTMSTGTDNVGAFNADQTQTVSAAYVQTEAQSTQDDLLAARQRIKALEDAMRQHGLID